MRKSIGDEIKTPFRSGDVVLQLIIINVLVFLLVGVCGPIFRLFGFPGFEDFMISVLAMPAKLYQLLFRPWTILTHMFLHIELFHLIGNLLILYFGGQLFTHYLGKKRILTVYILGGFSGALLFLLAFNTLPFFENMRYVNAINFGASAATMAIFVAIATYAPNFIVKVFFVIEMKLKYVAMILVLLSLMNIDKANAGGNIAHIGGAIFGFIYTQRLNAGKEIGNGLNQIIALIRSKFERNPKVVYTDFKSRTKNDDLYNSAKKKNQELIDTILDKISKSGYDSLSKEEKEILFKASKH